MSILTLVLLAFVCGLIAAKAFDLFKTLLVKLRHIRVEIDLGSEGTLTTQEQIGQGATNPVANPSLRGADALPARRQDRAIDRNPGDRPTTE